MRERCADLTHPHTMRIMRIYLVKRRVLRWNPEDFVEDKLENFSTMAVQIPDFEAKLDAEEFLDWPRTTEVVIEYEDVPKDMRVKMAALRLRNMLAFCGRT